MVVFLSTVDLFQAIAYFLEVSAAILALWHSPLDLAMDPPLGISVF